MCPNPGGFGEEFYSNSSRVGLLIRLGCVQVLHSFNLVSGNLFFLKFIYFIYLFLAALGLLWVFVTVCMLLIVVASASLVAEHRL